MQLIHNFINGEFTAAAGGKIFEKRSPLNNQVIANVAEAGKAEVDAAVSAARAALKGPWGRMTIAERVDMLYAVANEINRRFDDFLAAEVADTGKPMSLARHIDIPRGAANFKIFAGAGGLNNLAFVLIFIIGNSIWLRFGLTIFKCPAIANALPLCVTL